MTSYGSASGGRTLIVSGAPSAAVPGSKSDSARIPRPGGGKDPADPHSSSAVCCSPVPASPASGPACAAAAFAPASSPGAVACSSACPFAASMASLSPGFGLDEGVSGSGTAMRGFEGVSRHRVAEETK